MQGSDLMVDGFARVHEMATSVLEGLSADDLSARLDGGANTIAWLLWHLVRIQDDHIAAVDGGEQVWTAEGWSGRFGLLLDPLDTGYGHTPEQVAAVTGDPSLLRGYLDAVHGRTVQFLRRCGEHDWDRIVDEHWDPPVTLGVRVVSVLSDNLAHVGQADYARGLLERR